MTKMNPIKNKTLIVLKYNLYLQVKHLLILNNNNNIIIMKNFF